MQQTGIHPYFIKRVDAYNRVFLAKMPNFMRAQQLNQTLNTHQAIKTLRSAKCTSKLSLQI